MSDSGNSFNPSKVFKQVLTTATTVYTATQAAAASASAEAAAQASEIASKAAEAASNIDMKDIGDMVGIAVETVVDIVSEIV